MDKKNNDIKRYGLCPVDPGITEMTIKVRQTPGLPDGGEWMIGEDGQCGLVVNIDGLGISVYATATGDPDVALAPVCAVARAVALACGRVMPLVMVSKEPMEEDA